MSDRLGGASSTHTLRARRDWIARFRRLVATRTDAFVDLVVAEIGKPRHEALTSDLLPLLAACRWHERHLAWVLRPCRIRGGPIWLPGQSLTTVREPLGRVAIIATWNYPVQLLGVQLVQAIAGGNQVVVKPSEVAPRTQRLLLETAVDAGLPPGTLTWTDASREAGQALLLTERFDHIVFTGSTAVGRAIAEIAAQSLTPTTLELTGRDSAIVLDDADVHLAARTIWHAVTLNAGQTCMAPRRVLVEQRVYPAFVAALAPWAAAARPTTLVSEPEAARCAALARAAIHSGGRSASSILEDSDGPRLRPMAIVDCDRDAALVEGDHFGPVVAVLPVRDALDALHVHRRHDQHLATSVFTSDPSRVDPLRALLGSAIVTINDCVLPTGHPGASIGGRGESGWGYSRGAEGMRQMTRLVTVSRTSRVLRAPVVAPSEQALRFLRRAVNWLYGGRGGGRGEIGSVPPQASPSGARAPGVPAASPASSDAASKAIRP